jgi:glutamine amidotransferase
MIAVIDYRMGNLGSVMNAFEKVGAKAGLVKEPEELGRYDRAVLPGVGAFPDAMSHLEESGMGDAIVEFARSGKPLMGTCLGMQLLFDESEEFGKNRGLGLIPGKVVRFDESKFDKPLKVPHMGWNELFVKKDNPLFDGLPAEFYLYFVHSYHAVTDDVYVTGKSLYGYEFVSSVSRENVYGFQPHPEKSHDIGLKIVENFSRIG